jgi:integrase
MATIRKRNGRYQVQVRTTGALAQTKTFTYKADAEAWARSAELTIERGTFGDPRRLLDTLADVLQRYRKEVSPRKRGSKQEIARIDRLLRDPISKVSLALLSPEMLARFRDRRLKDGPVACSYDLTIISNVVNQSRKEWGYPLNINPVDLVLKPAPPRGRNRRLEAGEYERLTAAATKGQTEYLWPLVNLAIETAMRRGELLDLMWDRIDLNKSTAFLPLTKNGFSREVPLSPAAIAWLMKLSRIDKHVIPVPANAVRLAWDRLVRRARIDDLRFHDLRHEAISRFFERGLSIPEVALISGHREPRMLFRYTHLRAEDVTKKLNYIADLGRLPQVASVIQCE